jgi:hypothetical protein
MRRFSTIGFLVASVAGATPAGAGQQGIGQNPSGLPLTPTLRERGSSITPAFEGWYYDKEGAQNFLVGYFNRNTKQEIDIPAGPNNRVEPGNADQGQPTHFNPGRAWGVFSFKVPKDLGNKKMTWTIVANGFTNAITLHTQADYIVEPYLDAANKNTPPSLKFQPNGAAFMGAPSGIAEKYTATVGAPLALTVWASDEGPKINIPDPRGRGRGRGAAAPGAAAGDTPAGRGGAPGTGARANVPPEFQPAPPLALTWSTYRGPGTVKFDNPKPAIDRDSGGKTVVNATFSTPGDYILRVQGNDSTGEGGGGFQCCWTNALVTVTVGPATSAGGEQR